MKKIIILASVLVFLVATSFAGGVFVAKIKQETFGDISKKVESIGGVDASKKFSDMSKKTDYANITPETIAQVGNEVESEDAVFSFALLGDTQYFKPGASGNFQSAAGTIKKMDPDLVFAVGDLVSSCDGGSNCEEKFNEWKSVLGSLLSKTYVTQGNHDRTGKSKADTVWQKVFDLPTNGPDGYSEFVYSFDKGESHFIVLDSEKPKENLINDVQRNWLEMDLKANKKKNIFVFFHEPAFPVSSKIGEGLDDDKQQRDALWDILKKHKVAAVFNGHEHIQSRRKIDGIYQFVFGNTNSYDHDAPQQGVAEYYHVGEGFGIVQIHENGQIVVNLYSVEGQLLNYFMLPN